MRKEEVDRMVDELGIDKIDNLIDSLNAIKKYALSSKKKNTYCDNLIEKEDYENLLNKYLYNSYSIKCNNHYFYSKDIWYKLAKEAVKEINQGLACIRTDAVIKLLNFIFFDTDSLPFFVPDEDEYKEKEEFRYMVIHSTFDMDKLKSELADIGANIIIGRGYDGLDSDISKYTTNQYLELQKSVYYAFGRTFCDMVDEAVKDTAKRNLKELKEKKEYYNRCYCRGDMLNPMNMLYERNKVVFTGIPLGEWSHLVDKTVEILNGKDIEVLRYSNEAAHVLSICLGEVPFGKKVYNSYNDIVDDKELDLIKDKAIAKLDLKRMSKFIIDSKIKDVERFVVNNNISSDIDWVVRATIAEDKDLSRFIEIANKEFGSNPDFHFYDMDDESIYAKAKENVEKFYDEYSICTK